MNRLDYFKKQISKQPYRSVAMRIKEHEFDMLVEFIEDHDHLDRTNFALRVNRWFLDDPRKPKNWTTMAALAEMSNSLN